MIKSNKNKKKKGFTLVELIAVIAIIGILAAILVPTINGYITKAKKTKVIEQGRQFAMVVQTLKSENKTGLATDAAINASKPSTYDGNVAFEEIVPDYANDLKLILNLTFEDALKITAGTSDFTVKGDGTFDQLVTPAAP